MRFTTATLFALCSAAVLASPIASDAALEVRALDARQRVTTSVTCSQNPQGDTNDSNNNAKFIQGFGNSPLDVPKSGRQIAITRNTKTDVFASGGSSSSYGVPANKLAQALLEINYICGQTGKVSGLGTFPFADTNIYVIATNAN